PAAISGSAGLLPCLDRRLLIRSAVRPAAVRVIRSASAAAVPATGKAAASAASAASTASTGGLQADRGVLAAWRPAAGPAADGGAADSGAADAPARSPAPGCGP